MKRKTNQEKFIESRYKMILIEAYEKNLISRQEWENKLKELKEECGYCFLDYLYASIKKRSFFISSNKNLLKHKKHLKARFNVEIITPREIEEKFNFNYY